MSTTKLYTSVLEAKRAGRKQFAVLIDPDKTQTTSLDELIERAVVAGVDYFLVGSSLLVHDQLDTCLQKIKAQCAIPAILFPGNNFQVNHRADGILLLSLISGRNPELLIGQHVVAAPYLRKSNLEIIPTGYILIDGGVPTSVSYMSNSSPIPRNKFDIALCTAMAGEMLGLKMIYLEAGSGARYPVDDQMIQTVSQSIDIPLIVGGGLRSPETAYQKAAAGADLIVVGNILEKAPTLIQEMAQAVHGVRPEKV